MLVAFLIWQVASNDGFRFIWHRSEGELLMLQVMLGMSALVLIATGLQPSAKPEAIRFADATTRTDAGAGRWLVRAVVYVGGCLVAMYVAFMAGAAHYMANNCEDPYAECDVAALAGFVWSVIALPLCLPAVVVIELVLRGRRKRRRMGGRSASDRV